MDAMLTYVDTAVETAASAIPIVGEFAAAFGEAGAESKDMAAEEEAGIDY